MSQAQDISSVDAFKMPGAFPIYRIPAPMLIEFNANKLHIKIHKIENGRLSKKINPIDLPIHILQSSFSKWPNEKGNIYYKKPHVCYAVELKRHSFINNMSLEEGRGSESGIEGDYLITKESGLNEICKKEHFNNYFIEDLSKLKSPFKEEVNELSI